MRPKTFRLEKQTSSSRLLWEITVQGILTTVKASGSGQKPKIYPAVEHDTPKTAFRFTQNQINKKKKMGYEELGAGSRHQSHEDSLGSSGSQSGPSAARYERSRNRDRGDGDLRMLLQKKRHQQLNDTMPLDDIDDDDMMTDHDTDSVASSRSNASAALKNPRSSGVSPLNRRKQHLKAGESVMDAVPAPHPALLTRVSTTYFLRSQMNNATLSTHESVEMRSPDGSSRLAKMETMGKWENWRGEESTKGPAKHEHPARKQTAPYPSQSKQKDPYAQLLSKRPEQSNGSKKSPLKRKPSKKMANTTNELDLLHKQSTTSDIRQVLTNHTLDDQPSKFEGGTGDGLFINLPSPRIKLKRKSTTLLSPLVESSTSRESPIVKDVKKGVTKKVMVLSAEEGRDRRTSSPKRQLTIPIEEAESADGATSRSVKPAKRRCTSISRHGGLMSHTHNRSSAKDGLLYIPDKADWPISLDSQVVWRVPLVTATGRSLQGHSLFVDNDKCLVAVEDGTVIELDGEVNPVRGYTLPSGGRCLLSDGDFLYAGCEDGGLYDITHKEPRLITHIKGFGQLLSLDIREGLVAISDQHGNVALVSHSGDILWRHKSKGEFGWMVKIDDSAVYHGHSRGLTKYSIQDGCQIWHTDTSDAVYQGVKGSGKVIGHQVDDYLYLAVGHLVEKISKHTGVILQTYDKGKSETTVIHSLTVTDEFIITGGKHIVFYDLVSGDVVYVLKHPYKPVSMQYYQGRLICAGLGSVMAVDMTEPSIRDALDGRTMETVEVSLTSNTRQVAPLKRVPTISRANSQSTGGVLVECVKPQARKGKLMVKALSTVKNKSWAIQLPQDLQKEGARYLVEDLRPCPAGNFYRVYGEIKEVQ